MVRSIHRPADVGAQPVDSDLTTIGGLTATTDNFMQAKAGAWASRTLAQVVTDLAPLMPGYQLGYGASTIDVTSTSATFADVASVTTTVTIGLRPIVVTYGGTFWHTTASGLGSVKLLEDGAAVGQVYASAPGANGFVPLMGHVRLAPAAGSKVYKIQFANLTGSGTAHLSGSTTEQASFVHVVQL